MTYAYTADFNQLATYPDPRSGVTQYFYDLLGRLTEVKDPLLNSTRFEYDPQGFEWGKSSRFCPCRSWGTVHGSW